MLHCIHFYIIILHSNEQWRAFDTWIIVFMICFIQSYFRNKNKDYIGNYTWTRHTYSSNTEYDICALLDGLHMS